jgi:hypothetical protein
MKKIKGASFALPYPLSRRKGRALPEKERSEED